MTTTPFLPGLSPVETKPLTASQDAGNLSSNGGLIVLREAARRLGLAEVIAKFLPDGRNPMLVTHTYSDMITARMMAIAAGYEAGLFNAFHAVSTAIYVIRIHVAQKV